MRHSIKLRLSVVRAGVAVCAALAAASAVVPAAGVAGDPAGARDVEGAFHSRALGGTLSLVASLPPGYGDGARYPVVYFLHGLPAPPTAFRDIGLVRRAIGKLGGRAIIVAPQGARDGDSDAEYLDQGPGRNWETAIARELPAWVDRHYRTIADRRGRAIIGISAGGYGAMQIGTDHLDEFSVVESWSGCHRPTDPAGTHTLDLGSRAANGRASMHASVAALRKTVRALPTFIAFYVGSADSRFRADNVRLHHELAAAHIPHTFRIYPGGHEHALWSSHAVVWLGLALARLAPPAESSG